MAFPVISRSEAYFFSDSSSNLPYENIIISFCPKFVRGTNFRYITQLTIWYYIKIILKCNWFKFINLIKNWKEEKAMKSFKKFINIPHIQQFNLTIHTRCPMKTTQLRKTPIFGSVWYLLKQSAGNWVLFRSWVVLLRYHLHLTRFYGVT